MSDSTQTMLESVLQLSEQERTEFAMRVLESLPPDDGLAMDDEDLIEQLEERRKDTSGSISWTELQAEVIKQRAFSLAPERQITVIHEEHLFVHRKEK